MKSRPPVRLPHSLESAAAVIAIKGSGGLCREHSGSRTHARSGWNPVPDLRASQPPRLHSTAPVQALQWAAGLSALIRGLNTPRHVH